MKDYIKKIIDEYLRNKYPHETEDKIRYWLVDPENIEEKKEILSDYWNSLQVNPDIFVYESLGQVKEWIDSIPEEVQFGTPEEEPVTEETKPTEPVEEPEDLEITELQEGVEETPVIQLSPSDVIDLPVSYDSPVEIPSVIHTSAEKEPEEEKPQEPIIIHLDKTEEKKEDPVVIEKKEIIPPERKPPFRLQDDALLPEEPVRNSFRRGKLIVILIAVITLLAVGGYFLFSYESVKEETIITHSVPYGEQSHLALADGSAVWLNAGSLLEYPERLTSAEHRVRLLGEGYFKMEGNREKGFVVETEHVLIEGSGAEFNVINYPGDDRAVLTLLSGDLRITLPSGEVYTLVPFQQFDFNKQTAQAIILVMDAPENIDWREGKMVITDASFADILKRTGRILNVEFHIQNDIPEIENLYTVRFADTTHVEEVMAVLQELMPFSWQQEKNQIIIRF